MADDGRGAGRDWGRGLPARASLLLESGRMALGALAANKLRTTLTLLGMVIGVSTVVGMASILSGLDRSMARSIASLGSGIIYVSKYEAAVHVGETERDDRPDLKLEEANAIARGCPSLAAVCPAVTTALVLRWGEQQTKHLYVEGAGAEYLGVNDRTLTRGRFFTVAEVQGRSRVCVLGPAVIETLFGAVEPLGQRVRVGEWSYLLIGVMGEKGTFLGNNLDEAVVVPVTTLQEQQGWGTYLDYIALQPPSARDLPRAQDEVEEFLRRYRGLRATEESNFGLSTQDTLLDIYNKLTRAIYGVMLLVSAIGLMVGGIGIMNMMLVSVKERTAEIGVRRALGAQRRDVMTQFLAEAVTLTVAGGAAGIVVGGLMALLVAAVSPLPAVLPIPVVLIALLLSASVGLFFGLYPAWQAARLSPIEALRYE
jgi:putative ABC transport system permease protein